MGNDAAPMDTLRRATALRNAAAGQMPDETRHDASHAPPGDASPLIYSAVIIGIFCPVLVPSPYFSNNG
jgi:hypothetical protein